jgi:hypothetical protein
VDAGEALQGSRAADAAFDALSKRIRGLDGIALKVSPGAARTPAHPPARPA